MKNYVTENLVFRARVLMSPDNLSGSPLSLKEAAARLRVDPERLDRGLWRFMGRGA